MRFLIKKFGKMLLMNLIYLKVVLQQVLLLKIIIYDIYIYMNKKFILVKNLKIFQIFNRREYMKEIVMVLKDNLKIGIEIKDMIKIYYI